MLDDNPGLGDKLAGDDELLVLRSFLVCSWSFFMRFVERTMSSWISVNGVKRLFLRVS